jgi:hypothetical protein
VFDNVPKHVNDLVKELCNKPAKDARKHVSEHTDNVHLLRVCVHHGFFDLIHKFQIYPVIGAPGWTPANTFTLTDDAAENAWLWLLKGDRDIDDNVWAAMLAAGLFVTPSQVCRMLGAARRNGVKVTANDVLNSLPNQKEPTMLLAAVRIPDAVDAIECLLELGAEPNDYHDDTPCLLLSADPCVAQCLIEHNADVDMASHYLSMRSECDERREKRSADVELFLHAIRGYKRMRYC